MVISILTPVQFTRKDPDQNRALTRIDLLRVQPKTEIKEKTDKLRHSGRGGVGGKIVPPAAGPDERSRTRGGCQHFKIHEVQEDRPVRTARKLDVEDD